MKTYLTERIAQDDHFAKRCMALLNADCLLGEDIVALYKDLGLDQQ